MSQMTSGSIPDRPTKCQKSSEILLTMVFNLPWNSPKLPGSLPPIIKNKRKNCNKMPNVCPSLPPSVPLSGSSTAIDWLFMANLKSSPRGFHGCFWRLFRPIKIMTNQENDKRPRQEMMTIRLINSSSTL